MNKEIKSVVIIGPESTGKSTLSEDLARYFHTVSVAEYARSYLEDRNGLYCEQDLLSIASGQLATEDVQRKYANKILFCDTDLHVIKVWSEHKYNRCAIPVLQAIAVRPYDLYLLTAIDMPWQEDPLREHPHPEMRAYFFKVYLDIMQNTGVPFAVISGNREERLKAAITAIEAHI